MGFGDFLSKTARFAGKAIVAIASEVMNQGDTTLTKNYLETVKKLDLNSKQRDMIQQAERLNNRLSDQKRNQKNISESIKNNSTKITELKKVKESKEVEIWTISSKLIKKDNFYKSAVFDGEKFIVFSDEKNTKIPLSEITNSLADIELDANKIDKSLCDFFTVNIPEVCIETMSEGFWDELIIVIDEYQNIRKSNNKEMISLSDENISLENTLSVAKEQVAHTDSELRPLLEEIKAFCGPLIEEQKERNARSR